MQRYGVTAGGRACGLLAFAIALASFLSCGGDVVWGASDKSFVNKTNLQEAQFQALAKQKWHDAQEAIATEVQYDLIGGVVSTPDPETAAAARAVQPRNVIIRGIKEVPATELNALPSCQHCPYSDPSGFIYCPGNATNAKYCAAYLNKVCEIVVPDSKPDYMGPYEMENCILRIMGRDISYR
jgi:hypothetical protein